MSPGTARVRSVPGSFHFAQSCTAFAENCIDIHYTAVKLHGVGLTETKIFRRTIP